MKDFAKLKDLLGKLNYILSRQQKYLAVLVFAMSAVAALLEMLGVSIIIPIMDMLLNPSAVRQKWYIKTFVEIFSLDTDLSVVWFVCALAIGIYVIKNFYFIFYNWVSLKYSYKVQRELSTRVLGAYMKQGYLFFVNNNSARLLQGIGADVASVYSILNAMFNTTNKLLTILCIGIFIVFQSFDMALMLIMLTLLCFIIIQFIFRRRMRNNGIIRRKYQQQCTLVSIQAIQGNKEILVSNKQDYFVNSFTKMQKKVNDVSVKVDLGTLMPAYIIEMICVSGLLAAVAVKMLGDANPAELIGKLSTVAVAAFRILPALGTVSSGVNTITMNTSQLAAAYDTLSQVKGLEDEEKKREKEKYRKVDFREELEIKNLSFKYPGAQDSVLRALNLKIHRGTSIALIGASGAGKTTLADIILGLLVPDEGCIKMDGVDIQELGSRWNEIVGYVSQTVYMLDDTIRKNIAFGVEDEKIDDGRVWDALRIAQLDEYVRELPDQLSTMTGEHGIRFSGGQRQRIAIARAVYSDPEILVLDEATAALDNETETAVMEAIDALHGHKTLIIVAHRLTTIRNCDHVYEIGQGVAKERNKEEVLERNNINHER